MSGNLLRDRLVIREAGPADGGPAADVWVRSRLASVPAIPPIVHDLDDARRFIAGTIEAGGCDVALVDGEVVGMVKVDGREVDHVYVAPEHTGRGIGGALLDHVKAASDGELWLWAFEANHGARRFYERHDFHACASTDGVNEEGEPDLRYRWVRDAREDAWVDVDRLARALGGAGDLVRTWSPIGGIAASNTVVEWTDRAVVVRRFPDDDTARRLVREFRVASAAHAAGVPVPEPLLLDEDGSRLGTPASVSTYLRAVPLVGTKFPSRTGDRYAALLAQVHAVPLDLDLGLADRWTEVRGFVAETPDQFDASTDEELVRSELSRWQDWAAGAAEEHVLIHADVWPCNVLWARGAPLGLIDWEDARAGDPAADVGVTRLDLLWTHGPEVMHAFTNAYRARTGRSLETLPFWDLVAALRPAGNLERWTSMWPALGRPDLTADGEAEQLRGFVRAAIAAAPRR